MPHAILTDEARDALVDAALRGVEQCFGKARDAEARCAMGAITEALNGIPGWTDRLRYRIFLPDDVIECPADGLYGPCWRRFPRSAPILVHLNDFHHWDFLTIARKLGGDA